MDNEPPSVKNTTIFKINIEKYKDFEEARIEFHHSFLAYAKKHSVVNICKKFNQMVHDSLCMFKIKSSISGELKKGYIKIVNMKCTGVFGDINVKMSVDGANLIGNGLVGNYLLEKGYKFDLSEGSLTIEASLSNIAERDQK